MELIDRRKLVSDFWKGVEDGSILSYEDTDDLMENAPTVDAVEVVHGRWISEVVRKPDWKGKMRDYYQASSCSVCHKPDPGYGTSNYCPNCGAKMDGDSE